ncbi:MAG: hypothetical protein ACOC2N_03175, partial [Spirochaetota bacterium]
MRTGFHTTTRIAMLFVLFAGSVPFVAAQRMMDVSVEREVGEIRELLIVLPAAEIDVVAGREGLITVSGTMPMSTWEFWQGDGWIRSPEQGAFVLQLLGHSPSGRFDGRLEIALPPLARLTVTGR